MSEGRRDVVVGGGRKEIGGGVGGGEREREREREREMVQGSYQVYTNIPPISPLT